VNVLVVAAHPDDEVLGCGGTIARHTAEGDDVYVLVLGEGITARPRRGGQRDERSLAELRASASRAAEILRVKQLVLREFPDNRFDCVDLLEIVKVVEEIKAVAAPDIVYTHHWGDLNVDHRRTCDAVLTTFRPLPGERARELWTFEVPSATGWWIPSEAAVFAPNGYFDISTTLDLKIAALEAYHGEIRGYPHPRSSQAVRALAQYRGAQGGTEAAEAMVLVRLQRS
jgi:N-acetylglucosamine malate deacetylase 1